MDFHEYIEQIMRLIQQAQTELDQEDWECFVDDLVDALVDRGIM
jgi:hypothetical protein